MNNTNEIDKYVDGLITDVVNNFISNENTVEPVVVEAVVEPVLEAAVQPVVEPVQPVVEPVQPVVVEAAVQPVVEPVQPVVEAVVQPVVEAVVQPVVEPVVEAVVEPVVEAVVQPVVEPVQLVVVEAVVEPAVVEEVLGKDDYLKKIKSLEDLINLLKQEKLSLTKETVEEPIIDPVSEDKTPDIILIVPYRDRAPQRSAFMKIMPHILEDLNCKVLFVHQRDNRPFNRGSMKNLGFIYVKNMYPDNYKDITLVFHDIDNIPWYKGQFSYQTQRNVVNHFYGYHRALGGIFAIKAWDFEHINGFPNIWTWGLEDNMILRRVEQNKKRVIRSEFVNIEKDNNNIIGLWHGWDRLVNPHIEHKGRADRGRDGIRSLRNIIMNPNEMDNLFIEVNITSFHTGENLTSPFVKGARRVDARSVPRLNKPFYVKGPKRGTAGTFGKKRGFGGMAF